jgi:hypothetical protein
MLKVTQDIQGSVGEDGDNSPAVGSNAHDTAVAAVQNPRGDDAAPRHRSGRKRGPRSMGRYPFVTWLSQYAKVLPHVVAEETADVYVERLRYVHDILQLMRARKEIDTTDPARFGEKEIHALDTWMKHPERYLLPDPIQRRSQKKTELDPVYQRKLWAAIGRVLAYCGNPILQTMKARGTWKRPKAPPKAKVIKDESWVLDALNRIGAIPGWAAAVVKFNVAFIWYNPTRSKELRLAEVSDLDLTADIFRVMHPKGEGTYGVVGAPVDVPDAFHPHAEEYLKVRKQHLRLFDLDPSRIKPLVPNERGDYYNPKTWNSMRYKVFRQAGLVCNYRILRKSSLQKFMEDLEAAGYKDTALAELVALRGRHSVAVALGNYVEYNGGRVRKVVREVSRMEATMPPEQSSKPPASPANHVDNPQKVREHGRVKNEESERRRLRDLDDFLEDADL